MADPRFICCVERGRPAARASFLKDTRTDTLRVAVQDVRLAGSGDKRSSRAGFVSTATLEPTASESLK